MIVSVFVLLLLLFGVVRGDRCTTAHIGARCFCMPEIGSTTNLTHYGGPGADEATCNGAVSADTAVAGNVAMHEGKVACITPNFVQNFVCCENGMYTPFVNNGVRLFVEKPPFDQYLCIDGPTSYEDAASVPESSATKWTPFSFGDSNGARYNMRCCTDVKVTSTSASQTSPSSSTAVAVTLTTTAPPTTATTTKMNDVTSKQIAASNAPFPAWIIAAVLAGLLVVAGGVIVVVVRSRNSNKHNGNDVALSSGSSTPSPSSTYAAASEVPPPARYAQYGNSAQSKSQTKSQY